MPIDVLQYCIQNLESLPPDKFKELQGNIRSYIRREDVCDILLKIDSEKLQKKFKSEPNSLHFQARCLAGILTVELGVELIRWIQQTPLLNDGCGEKSCDSDEKPCESS
jgi:hypothetical protein